MSDVHLSSKSSFPQWIGQRAIRHADRRAVAFVDDAGNRKDWNYQQLWERACVVAAQLPTTDDPQPRALLLYPPGIEFLAAFLGCQLAGWTPVPTCYPRPGREVPRLDSAAIDCQPSAILGDQESIDGLAPEKLSPPTRAVPRIAVDHDRPFDESCAIDPDSLSIAPESLAFLQYTSGSTSDPKGVMVQHQNLMANLEAIRRGFQVDMQPDDATDVACGVFWLPFFHDMGLIGGILAPLYVGGQAILMSPRAFLQRPLRWLQLISDNQAAFSGAPNFAYQLCVDRISPDQTNGLNLSHWRLAFSGAEPVLPRTLHDFAARFGSVGFSESAFYPCYGLAEATLLAAGGEGPAKPTVVSFDREALGQGRAERTDDSNAAAAQLVCCGKPAHETEVLIVDPEQSRAVAENVVGEIWLRGGSITAGYWNRDEENELMFNASLEGQGDGFCRTGDLGFLHDGQLYVTGRRKDVIILRGRNLFPQDIENTIRETIGSESGQCAAFSVQAARGEGLAIVAEIPRRADESNFPQWVRSIRRAVIEVHEVDPRHVLLVRQATVPLTSSGKVQRSRCRELFDSEELTCKYRYDRASGATQTPLQIPSIDQWTNTTDERHLYCAETEQWMTQWLVARAGVAPSEVDLEKPFADYGLDSMTAVEMSGEIEDWSGVQTTPIIAWNYPTVSKLSVYIVNEVLDDGRANDLMTAGDTLPKQHPADNEPSLDTSGKENLNGDELYDLLGEIENLSEEEVKDALADEQGR